MKSLHVLICVLGAASALYSSNSPVIKLTQANFEKEVKGSSDLWFVEFFAPWCGHCKNLAPEYEKAAKALKGVIKVGAVDMTTDQAVGAPYDVKGFPTLKFFGENKSKPLDYNGGRTAKDIVDFAMSQAQDVVRRRMGGSSGSSSSSGSRSSGHEETKGDGDVIVLDDSSFDKVFDDNDLWLVEFYAPWCGHCKNLAPEWSKAATNLKGQVKVAKVDATANERLASKYGVKGYPTIKVFLPNSKERAEDYNGPRDADGITNFALQKLEAFGVAPELKQLTGSNVLESECPASEARVCVIVFLPHIMDSSAKERENYLDNVRAASKKARSKPIRFLWAQGGDHYSFEEKLGMSFGYPAVMALSTQKSRYAIMRSAFNAAELESFVSKILNGSTALIPYEKLPKLGSAEPWDGKDAPAMLFSGLGSAGVLTLLGGLWLLQRVGGPGLLCVVAGQGLMVVSSLMGMLACYRHSRSLVLDREEEVKELLGWALCALLLPTLTNIEIALSAFLFPQPLLQLTEGFSLTMEQGNLVLWVAGLVFSTLGAVCIGTIAYGVLTEPRWALASDCLIWLNFLLVLIGQTILIAAIHLRRVTLLRNVSIGMEEFLGVMIAIVGYVGARAVQTSSLILLRVYVLLGVVCAGVGLVAAVYGWLAGVRVSTHLSADCLDAMASAHSSQLEDLNCATKYTNFSLSLESLPCSKPEMRLDWESISLNSLQDFACLNSTCCSQLPLSLEATSESISVQVLGAAIASGLAAGLVLAFVRQMTYDDKDHFAGICVLLGMLVSTVGVGVWLSLSKPYLSETQAAPGSHSIRLPMRLFEPGGCVTGLTLPSQPCSHCKFTVTTENSLLYDHGTPLQTTTLQGSQPETATAFSSLIVCPICPISTMTVLVTPEGSTVPEVNTFEWTSRVNVFGTVYFEDEPLPDVEVDLDVPGCQIVTFNSDDKGRYQVSVPLAPDLSPYNVTLHFTKDGFLPVSLRHSIGGITSFNEFPAVDMTPHSLLFSSVAVYLFDVTTNTRISSGRVEVREGYNNITGEVKDAVEVVEGVGMVEELRPGVYTLVCSSQGLYTDVTEVTVLPNSHQEKAALLSPIQSGLRVVLGWESERDMDLSVQFAGCWVGFFNKMCGAAQLHADNRLGGSSGGEALTFTSLQSGSYLFTVNSFRSASDSGSATLRFYWHSPLPFLRLELEPDSPGVCLDGTSMFVSPVGVEGNCTSHELPEVSGWVARPK